MKNTEITMTKKQFEEIKQYENIFHKAVYGGYISFMPTHTLKELNILYNELIDPNHKIKGSCGSCVIKSVAQLGLIYFNEKVKYESKNKQSKRSTKGKSKQDNSKGKRSLWDAIRK